MIKEAHERLEAALVTLERPGILFLGRIHMTHVASAFPRIVMAPSKGPLTKGGQVKAKDTTGNVVATRALARRNLPFIFWVQGQTYDDVEVLTGTLIQACKLADFTFHEATEDWRDEQLGEGMGVTCIVVLNLEGAFLEPDTTVQLDEPIGVTPTPCE